MLALAVPVVVAEMGWVAMGTVDILMVGSLGPEAIGAVGVGSMLFIALAVFGVGVLLALDTFIAQRSARASSTNRSPKFLSRSQSRMSSSISHRRSLDSFRPAVSFSSSGVASIASSRARVRVSHSSLTFLSLSSSSMRSSLISRMVILSINSPGETSTDMLAVNLWPLSSEAADGRHPIYSRLALEPPAEKFQGPAKTTEKAAGFCRTAAYNPSAIALNTTRRPPQPNRNDPS